VTTFILYRKYFRTEILDGFVEVVLFLLTLYVGSCEGVKGVKGDFETILFFSSCRKNKGSGISARFLFHKSIISFIL